MAIVGSLAFLVIPAFLAGIIAAMVFNYISYRRWLKSTKRETKGWYHTWHRR